MSKITCLHFIQHTTGFFDKRRYLCKYEVIYIYFETEEMFDHSIKEIASNKFTQFSNFVQSVHSGLSYYSHCTKRNAKCGWLIGLHRVLIGRNRRCRG